MSGLPVFSTPVKMVSPSVFSIVKSMSGFVRVPIKLFVFDPTNNSLFFCSVEIVTDDDAMTSIGPFLLALSNAYQLEAIINVLERKGLLTSKEVLKELEVIVATKGKKEIN